MTPASGSERRRGGRSDLASLRIDRSAEPPRRPRRGLAIGIALGVVALLAAGAALWWSRPLEVRVGYARRSVGSAPPATEVLSGSGYVVTADRYISLGVRVASRIVAYHVEEGDTVEARQVLVELDARQYQAALDESRAALERARANLDLHRRELERASELFDRDAMPEADLDLADNQVRVTVAEIARLGAQIKRQEVDLEDTVVRAPTGGVILEKLKEVGEIAVPGGFQGSGDLIRMANLDDLRVELDINEADLGRIALDQPARVVPEAYPDRAYEARVVKLHPQINRQKGTLEVEAKILEPDAWLRPDMSARVTFLAPSVASAPASAGESADAPPVVLVPAAAVQSAAGASFAWIVRESRAERRSLELAGTSPDGQRIVTKGLSGGEALVVDPPTDLRDGQRVVVTP